MVKKRLPKKSSTTVSADFSLPRYSTGQAILKPRAPYEDPTPSVHQVYHARTENTNPPWANPSVNPGVS